MILICAATMIGHDAGFRRVEDLVHTLDVTNTVSSATVGITAGAIFGHSVAVVIWFCNFPAKTCDERTAKSCYIFVSFGLR